MQPVGSLTTIDEAGLKDVSSKGLSSDDPVTFILYPLPRAAWAGTNYHPSLENV